MACMRDGFDQGKLLDNRFLTIAPLNHGSFGMVFKAEDTWTGNDVAVKCITKPGAQEAISNCPAAIAIDERSEELAVHSRLPTHNNIVNLIHHFETKHHQYMVLELCSNGDLYEAIRVGRGPLETEHVRDFMLQLIDAVDHLHCHGVYHRDIKPENIFLASSGTMKLGDFGLATTETWSTEFAVGSDRYMAPEQFDASVYGYGYSPASADVWAIGIVLLNVLFQRNPFATPTEKDPLFADFANDRQSLFDVFPTMSQDTYNVIRHSLALDPANRSLAAVREALKSVLSFTTDDESLDDFCTEKADLVPMATAAREPLRTPSIASAAIGPEDSFPWTNVLSTPQKPGRQLSTIPDEEQDLFPGSVESTWQYVDTDEASLSSNLDSGLGMSYKSTKSTLSKPSANFVSSLPITFTRPGKAMSPYGATTFSKSWSDLWDEDNETPQDDFTSLDLGVGITRVSTAKPSTPRLPAIEDSHGSATPRQGKADLDHAALSSGTVTPMASERPVELLKTRSSSILDKWAALGNFRRAKQDIPSASVVPAAEPIPPKTKYTDAFANFPYFGSRSKQQDQSPKPRERTSGRQNARPTPTRVRSHSSSGRQWERKERDHSPKHPAVPAILELWSLDNNWREHKPPAVTPQSSTAMMIPSSGQQTRKNSSTPQTHNSSQPRLNGKSSFNVLSSDFQDDLGDLEWVGGWKDFHL